MNRYGWDWSLKNLKQDKNVKVMTTFSCGGGSSMGYKRAGFEVLANVEIDPKINQMYVENHHPKYNYEMDLRDFNKLEDLPEELYHLDILDGSPPCTTFSTAGIREKSWGKKKKFREGQKEQTLDDLFFVFLDTVEKLQPRIVIAENVTGLVKGNAKGYVNLILKRFKELGYDVQLFLCDGSVMDTPQARERVFFIANRCGFPKIKLDFHYDMIPFGVVREEHGKEIADTVVASLLKKAQPGDKKFEHVYYRLTGKRGLYFTNMIVNDKDVCPTITSGGTYARLYDKTLFTDHDFVSVSSFPRDYNFCGNSVQYVCGMSVPPNMMANIATEVYLQWLKK